MSSFKNFLITFLASILLFGLVGYFTTHYISGVVGSIIEGDISNNDKNSDESENIANGNNNSDSLKVPEGESYTFLIVCTDYKPNQFKDYTPEKEKIKEIVSDIDSPEDSFGLLSENSRRAHATVVVLVRVDKENREYASCYISPETRIFTPAGSMTLYDTYGLYGINTFKEYITSLTGLHIDYHFLIDGYKIPDFVNSFGSVTCHLDTDVYASGKYHVTQSSLPEEGETEIETEAETEGTETGNEEVKKPTIVLSSGKQELTDYNINILNTLKECSASDIELKESYIIDIVEQYLKKIADCSEQELEAKISQLTSSETYTSDNPLEEKPVLATNFTTEEVGDIYEMIGAVEYFDFVNIKYPGNYVETGDDSLGYYAPTLKTAIEDFIKYR